MVAGRADLIFHAAEISAEKVEFKSASEIPGAPKQSAVASMPKWILFCPRAETASSRAANSIITRFISRRYAKFVSLENKSIKR